MTIAPGTRLGPYEILAAIGAGGMGQVFKARDPRLDRIVAIKILLPETTGDADRKLRFLQEAKAASALNHPNIVTIYDVGSENGVDYIAMEFIDGKTVDQLIPRNGMRIGELLRYATQAADALAKAHQAGIVHRDLKPSNVMVSPDGLVKILDFGLAKLAQPPDSAADATKTIRAVTNDGTVLGTAFYMSPEQAEGKPVDVRSDIFSFGAMLFEMATGQRPFSGDSQLAVLSSVLREDAKPVAAIRTDVPPELAKVIARCLRKDPARRYQHTADLKLALEELKEESDSGSLTAVSSASVAVAEAARRTFRPWIWAALGAFVAALAFTVWRLGSASAPPAERSFTAVPVTSYAGSQSNPSFSPDGNQIAFAWDGPQEDNADIYVKLIGPGAPLRLTTDPAPDIRPSWSPDGRSIAFLRMGPQGEQFSVIVIPALGGPERRVGVFANKPVTAGLRVGALCWTPDSKALIVSAAESPATANRLVLVPLEGGEAKTLTHPDPSANGDTRPSLSGDGHQLAFLRTSNSLSGLFVVSLSAAMEPAGEPRPLGTNRNNVTGADWLSGDRELVFSLGLNNAASSLFRIATAKGAEEQLVAGPRSAFNPTVSRTGNRLAYASGTSDSNFWSVDLTTKRAAPAPALSSSYRDVFPQFSPDGKRVAFYSGRSGSTQIWVANTDGSQATALTSLAGPTTGSPRCSPDGQRIAFDSNTGGTYQVYVVAADGGQPRKLTPGLGYLANWSQDGRWIYFTSSVSGGDQIWKIPAGGGQPIQLTRGGGSSPAESPDGKTVYFVRQNGNAGIWKVPVEGGPEIQASASNVFRANYVVTEKGIYFTPSNGRDGMSSVQFLNFATGKTAEIVKIPKPIDLGLGLSPDGKTLLYSQVDRTGSNIMLIENFR